MKHPAASPDPACATHGPYASSMAAAVSMTKADTTRIMICRDSQAHRLGRFCSGLQRVPMASKTDMQQLALRCKGMDDASGGMTCSCGLRSIFHSQ